MRLINKIFFITLLTGTIVCNTLLAGHAQDSNDLVTGVEKVAQQIGPAVVSIKTERTQHYRAAAPFTGNPFYDDFFTEFFGGSPEHEEKHAGLGSGVIIDNRGYILTNEHVVRGAERIIVTLPDQRNFKGVVKGIDSRSDLALVKIDGPDLPVAALGNSDNTKIGQWVVAIGNPFGHILADPEPTVTTGVISALHRSLPRTSRRDTDYSDLIQTDAAINPGNSGGPLVNLAGEVIGINVAIFSTSGGYQGIGFAIPINYAKLIVDQLIQGKSFDYGWIGISIQEIDQRLAQYFGLPGDEGVLVHGLVEGGPAQQAGIQSGDIILSVNNGKIRNTAGLIRSVASATIGKSVTVEIIRDRKKLKLEVAIGKRPSLEQPKPAAETAADKPAASGPPVWRGMTVIDMSSGLTARLNLPATEGIMIVEIQPNSPAALAGLRKGDVITNVNKTAVRSTDDFNQALTGSNGGVLIRTLRGTFIVDE